MKNETKNSSLLDTWKNREKKTITRTRISKAPDGATIPLSSGQQRLWFLQRLLPENPVYNYAESFIFKGELNEDALEHSLRSVFEENHILRAFYPYEDGGPVQVINEGSDVELKRFDLSGIPKVDLEKQKLSILMSDAIRHFELEEFPLVRTTLIKLNNEEHVFLLTMHHIIFDKWSMDLFLKELAAHYVAYSNGREVEKKDANNLQFTDYAFWRKNRELDASQMAYWKKKLGGEIPLLALPTDYPLPASPSYKGTSYRTKFSGDLSKRVLDLSKKMETTPYVFLLSVYYVLLHKYSGQKDILVGSPISLRNDTALENIIGFFDETAVLRTSVPTEIAFSNFVKQVRTTVLDAFSNTDVPFETLVKALSPKRSLSVNPFFRVMFIYHSVTEVPSFGPELQLSHSFFNPGVSKFDLTLYVANENGLLSTGFEYATDIFEKSTIIQFQEHLRLLLETITAEPNQKIGDIAMLTEREKAIFLEKPNVVDSNISSYTGIHHVIEHVAKTQPDKTAVTFDGVSISYETLDRKAGRVANALLEKTKKSNETVVLCVDRSIDMIVGMLGILKAGCAYLPIDPNYPSERLDFILANAQADIIVTQSSLTSIFDDLGKELVLLDTVQETNSPTLVTLPKVNGDANAYIIYTSGSSGQPKGVPITHNSIINSTAGRLDFYPNDPDAFLLLSSIAFDSSKAGIFWTLCTGGNLIITENRIEQDISKIGDFIQAHSVTHTLMLPSLYKLILEHGDVSNLGSLNTVMVAGEAFAPGIVDLHFKKLPDTGLYNEYGPTEACVWCTAHRVEQEDASKGVPIGKPVAGSEIYLLNETMNLVPYGAIGEIFIGGPGISRGYINKPELSETSFVPHPFHKNGVDRVYKTGDLGRYRKDGAIEFLGRADHQVKIRGYRIELEELEKVLLNDSSITDAVALVHESDSESSRRLVAYIVVNEAYDADVVKRSLKSKIPDYMIPSRLIVVDSFPVLPNAKIDIKALRDLGKSKDQKEPDKDALPTNAIEKKLVGIWEDVLNFAPIGIHDNFFEIGGDSILSIQVIAKARASGMLLSPNQFFEYQTIAELADYTKSKNRESKKGEKTDVFKHLVLIRATGSKPALFCLHSGGSHFFFYNLFAEYLPSDRPVYAVQASGHEGEPTLHKSVAEMATDFIGEIKKVQPNGPYHLLSYCFNTAVGLEIVRILERESESANLIVADTMADYLSMFAPSKTGIRTLALLERLKVNPISTVLGFMKSKVVVPLSKKLKDISSSGNQRTIRRLHNNHIKIYSRYTWRPVESRVQLLLTQKTDIEFNTMLIASWEKLAKKGVDVVPVKGNHGSLFLAPTAETTAQSTSLCMQKFEMA
ncbi:non-ribosomal peptide synthetase [Pricia antarctica]|uniref:non-ribosomal peptide synthetase n=1 Tax=Pricia antarctica TaxID=641691 RepID=UPI001586FD57|nr:non-ribosomal peptide synthetase [Pricia antarctica]